MARAKTFFRKNFTDAHRENPVKIFRRTVNSKVRYAIENEYGDDLNKEWGTTWSKTMYDAMKLCFDNGCYPIPVSWGVYHFGPEWRYQH